MVHFIWHVMTEILFFTSSDQSRYTLLVMSHYPISWIIFILDVGSSYTDKLLEFRWVQIAHLSWLIYLYTATKEISWILLTMIIKLIADVIEAFNSTSRYLDDLLNIDNSYFEGMVKQIYPPEVQLNKANISDIEALFLDLHLSVEDRITN